MNALKKGHFHNGERKLSDMAKALKMKTVASRRRLSRLGSLPKVDPQSPLPVLLESRRRLWRREFALLAMRRGATGTLPSIEVELREVRNRLDMANFLVSADADIPERKLSRIVAQGMVQVPNDASEAQDIKARWMTQESAKDALLKSYLPQFRKLVKPDDIIPYPIQPTASDIALNTAIEAAEKSIQRCEPNP